MWSDASGVEEKVPRVPRGACSNDIVMTKLPSTSADVREERWPVDRRDTTWPASRLHGSSSSLRHNKKVFRDVNDTPYPANICGKICALGFRDLVQQPRSFSSSVTSFVLTDHLISTIAVGMNMIMLIVLELTRRRRVRRAQTGWTGLAPDKCRLTELEKHHGPVLTSITLSKNAALLLRATASRWKNHRSPIYSCNHDSRRSSRAPSPGLQLGHPQPETMVPVNGKA